MYIMELLLNFEFSVKSHKSYLLHINMVTFLLNQWFFSVSIHGFKDLPNECKYRFFLNLHKTYMYVQRASLILLPVMYIHVRSGNLDSVSTIFRLDFVRRRVWRYKRGYQNPYIKEQTTQWNKDTKGLIRIRRSKKNRQHNGIKIPKG